MDQGLWHFLGNYHLTKCRSDRVNKYERCFLRMTTHTVWRREWWYSIIWQKPILPPFHTSSLCQTKNTHFSRNFLPSSRSILHDDSSLRYLYNEHMKKANFNVDLNQGYKAYIERVWFTEEHSSKDRLRWKTTTSWTFLWIGSTDGSRLAAVSNKSDINSGRLLPVNIHFIANWQRRFRPARRHSLQNCKFPLRQVHQMGIPSDPHQEHHLHPRGPIWNDDGSKVIFRSVGMPKLAFELCARYFRPLFSTYIVGLPIDNHEKLFCMIYYGLFP